MAHQRKAHEAPLPKITNMVSTVELGCTLNLEKICKVGYKYVEHTKCSTYTKGNRFPAVVALGLRGTSVIGRIFSNGKMVCMGATTDEGSRLAARKCARIIQKMGYPRAKFMKFGICNVAGKWDVKFQIRLVELKAALGPKNCTYDEERPQVLYYKMKQPKATLGIFQNGKVTILGAKSDQHVYEACKSVYPILRKFRKKTGSSTRRKSKK